VIDFVVLKEKFIDVEMVDWAAVAESRKAGKAENWCDTESLKLASNLLHRWFLAKNGSQNPPKIAQDARLEADPALDTAQSPIDPSAAETVAPAEAERRNQTWQEQWSKEPTYPKYFVPNDYLASRGIRLEVLAEFGVGFYSNPKSKSIVNNRILYPIHNQRGELLAFAARTTEDSGARYWFPPIEKFDRSLELWNLHQAIKEGRNVYVIEGFFGCMNLWQNGYRCVVALMGSNLSEAQAELLVNEFETATFLLDPDEAGGKLKRQVIDRLLSAIPVRIMEPQKQADEMSAEELKALL